MYKYFLLISIFFAILSCENIKKDKGPGQENKSEKNDSEIQVRKKYNDEGRVITEVPYRGNLKHGVAKHFYPNGKVSMEIPYVNNQKQGTSYYYYTNGNVFRTTPYVNGKIQGIRKKYYENGKLMAEIPYRNGQPISGLKEWTEDGKLLTRYPKIIFKEINKVESENKIYLQIYFSDKSKNVEFYKNSINTKKDTIRTLLIVENGISLLEYYVPQGKVLNENIEIVGIKKTKRRNEYVDAAKYQLIVKN